MTCLSPNSECSAPPGPAAGVGSLPPRAGRPGQDLSLKTLPIDFGELKRLNNEGRVPKTSQRGLFCCQPFSGVSCLSNTSESVKESCLLERVLNQSILPRGIFGCQPNSPLGVVMKGWVVFPKKNKVPSQKSFCPPPSLGLWRKAMALRSLLYGTSKRLDPSAQNFYHALFGVTTSYVYTGIDGVGGSHPTTYCLRIC